MKNWEEQFLEKLNDDWADLQEYKEGKYDKQMIKFIRSQIERARREEAKTANESLKRVIEATEERVRREERERVGKELKKCVKKVSIGYPYSTEEELVYYDDILKVLKDEK